MIMPELNLQFLEPIVVSVFSIIIILSIIWQIRERLKRILEELGLWSFFIFYLLLLTFRCLGVEMPFYLGGSAYGMAENETWKFNGTLCPQDGSCVVQVTTPFWELLPWIVIPIVLGALLILYAVKYMPSPEAKANLPE